MVRELGTGFGTEIKFIDLTQEKHSWSRNVVVQGLRGETKRELLFYGLRISALQDEMFRDLFTTMWVDWTPLSCTLKNGEGDEFHVMCIFFFLPWFIKREKNGYYKDSPVTAQTKYTALPQPPSVPPCPPRLVLRSQVEAILRLHTGPRGHSSDFP